MNKLILFLLICLGAGQLFGAAPTKFVENVWDSWYRRSRAEMASKPYSEMGPNQQAAFRLLAEKVYNDREKDLNSDQQAEYEEFVKIGGLNAIGNWLTKHIRYLVADAGVDMHPLVGPGSYDELINQIKVVGVGQVYFDGMMRTLPLIQKLEDWLVRDGGWQNVAVIEAVIFAFGKLLAKDFGYRDLYVWEMFGDRNKVELASFLLFLLKYKIYTRNDELKVAFPERVLMPAVVAAKPSEVAMASGSGGSAFPIAVVDSEETKLALLASEFGLSAAQQDELLGLLREIEFCRVNRDIIFDQDIIKDVLVRDPDLDKSADRNLHRAQAKALIQEEQLVMPDKIDSIDVIRWRDALGLWK